MSTAMKTEDLVGRTSPAHLDDALLTVSGRPVCKIKAEPIVQDAVNVPAVSKTEMLVADAAGSIINSHSSRPVPENGASNERPFPVALFQHKPTRISVGLTTANPCKPDKSRRNIAVESTATMSSMSHDITADNATSASGVNSQKEMHQCSLCDYRSVHKWHFLCHMRTHTGEKPFKCSVCEYRSAKKVNVVAHMRTHTGEKPFMCSLCDSRFAQSSHLATHSRRHTGEKYKPYKCPLCDYRSSQKYGVIRHTGTHTGDYRSDNSGLASHTTTHPEKKPYKCLVCDYSSSMKSCLASHMSTHAGEKPYKCSVCEYSSAYKHVLVIHMRTHTGEKPYECSVCYLRFAKNSNLASHMRTHVGQKPYKG